MWIGRKEQASPGVALDGDYRPRLDKVGLQGGFGGCNYVLCALCGGPLGGQYLE